MKLKYELVKNKLLGQFFTINFSKGDEINPIYIERDKKYTSILFNKIFLRNFIKHRKKRKNKYC